MSNTSMNKTITLVCTPELAHKYCPEAQITNGRLIAAEFPINPAACETKLGRWLAETISTTRRDDDASRVQLVMPATNAGAELTNLGKAMANLSGGTPGLMFPGYLITDQAQLARAVTLVRSQLERIEQQAHDFGQAEFTLRVADYTWPVFGSHAAGAKEGIDTPEKFFDFCAREIRKTGGVILKAGLNKAQPEESVLRTLNGGNGLALLNKYKAQLP